MTRAEVIVAVRGLPRRLAQSEAVTRAVAEKLAELCRADLEVKSQGGAGADGVRWRPDAALTVKLKGHDAVGVNTGEMFRAVTPDHSEPGMARVDAPTDHTASFDSERPLFPETIPEAWMVELAEAGASACRQEILSEIRAELAGE